MNEFMLKMLGPIIHGIVNDLLKPENMQIYGDKLFDFIEDYVENSKTTIDDVLVLPIVTALRNGLGIEDND
jgi:hypothetical protein